jgi:hypothetical protein
VAVTVAAVEVAVAPGLRDAGEIVAVDELAAVEVPVAT